MDNAVMEATGLNARISLLKDVVRIQRIGLRNFLSGDSRIEKDILVSQIVSINFKKAGLLSNGYIEFILMPFHQGRDRDVEDECEDIAVPFRPGQEKAFEALREMLEARIGGGGVARPASAAATDLDQLEKLASLRDRGIISEEEFGRKKRQLLGL